jgi:hypothetical protein
MALNNGSSNPLISTVKPTLYRVKTRLHKIKATKSSHIAIRNNLWVKPKLYSRADERANNDMTRRVDYHDLFLQNATNLPLSHYKKWISYGSPKRMAPKKREGMILPRTGPFQSIWFSINKNISGPSFNLNLFYCMVFAFLLFLCFELYKWSILFPLIIFESLI